MNLPKVTLNFNGNNEFPCVCPQPSTMEDSLQWSIMDLCVEPSHDYLSIHNSNNIQIGMDNDLPSDVCN